jgi:hypothetical protein
MNQQQHDFLNEGQGGAQDDFFAPAQPTATNAPNANAPQQTQTAPQQQPAQRFIPEGFENPQALQQRIERRKEEMRRLNMKLSRAGNTDHTQNPYARKRNDNTYDFDQVAYDSDKRAYDAIALDVSEMNMKLSNMASMVSRLQDGVTGSARQVWQAHEARIPAGIRDAVRDYYVKNVQYLIGIGHFQDPNQYKSQADVQRGLTQIVATAIGAVSLSGNESMPSGRSAGGREEQAPQEDDEFAGWEPEARRMFEAGMASGARKRETLAERAKREVEEARARQTAGER